MVVATPTATPVTAAANQPTTIQKTSATATLSSPLPTSLNNSRATATAAATITNNFLYPTTSGMKSSWHTTAKATLKSATTSATFYDFLPTTTTTTAVPAAVTATSCDAHQNTGDLQLLPWEAHHHLQQQQFLNCNNESQQFFYPLDYLQIITANNNNNFVQIS